MKKGIKQLVQENKSVSIFAAIILLLIIVGAVRGQEGQSQDNQKSVPQVEVLSLEDQKENQSIVQASGEVESLQQVELKSEVSARITRVYTKLGQKVRAGQVLVQMNASQLAAQRSQALASLQAARAGLDQVQAGVNSQQSILDELKKGPTQEDIEIAKTGVQTAENSLEKAERGVVLAEQKAQVDLENAYESVLNTSQIAFSTAINSMVSFTTLQEKYYPPGANNELPLRSQKAIALDILIGAFDAGRWSVNSITSYQGGLRTQLMELQQHPNPQDVQTFAQELIRGLQATDQAFILMPITGGFSAADTTVHQNAKQANLAQITALTNALNGIETQKEVNESAIQAANTALQNAQNAVVSAQKQLAKVQAGASQQKIDSQQAQVDQAQAGFGAQQAQIRSAQAQISAIDAQLANYSIRAPISGTISVLNATVGELSSPGQLQVSIVNQEGLQVKAFVDSSALRFLQVGDSALIAGGQATGTVTNIAPSIDPATKKVEVIIAASNPEQSGLVVGEFVDVEITITRDIQNSAIRIPLKAVQVNNTDSVVYVIGENGIVESKSVIVGSVVGDEIEIFSGLENVNEILKSTRGIKVGETVERK